MKNMARGIRMCVCERTRDNNNVPCGIIMCTCNIK